MPIGRKGNSCMRKAWQSKMERGGGGAGTVAWSSWDYLRESRDDTWAWDSSDYFMSVGRLWCGYKEEDKKLLGPESKSGFHVYADCPGKEETEMELT